MMSKKVKRNYHFLFTLRIPKNHACKCIPSIESKLTLKKGEKGSIIKCSCGATFDGFKMSEDLEKCFEFLEIYYSPQEESIAAYFTTGDTSKAIDEAFIKALNKNIFMFLPEDWVMPMKRTDGYELIQISENFKAKLLDHQLRNISWMLDIEEGEASESNSLRNTGKLENVIAAAEEEPTSFQPRGGFLADAPGTGKTITMLGLIHHKRTGCNLIICHDALHRQWLEEAQICTPHLKIISIATSMDMFALKFDSIAEFNADLVIMSETIARQEYKKTKSSNSILRMAFQRLIMDELLSENDFFKEINVQNVWILDGKLKFRLRTTDTFKLNYPFKSKLVSDSVEENFFIKVEFISKFICCNEFSVAHQANSIIYEDLVINLNQLEGTRLRSNYYPLYSNPKQKNYDIFEISLQGAKKYILEYQNERIKDVERGRDALAKIQENDRLDTFQELFNNLPSEIIVCKICSQIIPSDQYTILPCAHVFCLACARDYVQDVLKRCPVCKFDLKQNDSTYSSLSASKPKVELFRVNLNCDFHLHPGRFSGALFAVYDCVMKVLIEPEANILLCSGNHDLNSLVATSLFNSALPVVDVNSRLGSEFYKYIQKSRIFVFDPSFNQVGFNVPKVTHIVFLEPFPVQAAFMENYCLTRARSITNLNSLKIIKVVPKLQQE